jgi:hypothetical protein
MAKSFFLDPDEAKTLGNLDYMRTARKVKKSYRSSQAWGSGFEEESVISSMERISPNKPPEIIPEVKVPEEAKREISQRHHTAPDLGIFRKMAKDINKS